jgi:phage shock protein PspC (stress-responsive transcriptional regulator)
MVKPKKLYRSRKDKVIAGVCGGIADYFNIDPVWIRLAAVLLVLADGVGIIFYILAWILVPQNPNQKDTKNTSAEEVVEKIKTGKVQKRNSTPVLGIIILIIGIGLLMKNIFSWFKFSYVWPAGVIILGLYLLVGKNEK